MLAGAALYWGCASYEARPIDPQRGAELYAARELDDPAVVRFAREELKLAYPPRSWDLQSLWAAALSRDAALEGSRAEVAAREAVQQTSRQLQNPELGMQLERVGNPSAGVDPWIAGLQTWFPLATGDRREQEQGIASVELAIARLAPEGEAWQARLRVREALMATIASEAAAALAAQAERLAERNESLARAGVAAGASSGLELRAAEDARALSAQERGALELAAGAERARLAAAVGVRPEAMQGVPLETAELETVDACAASSRELVALGLRKRAEVLRALGEYELSERELALEVARARPDLRIGPGVQFDQGATKWQLGLSIELPLFHQHQGQIAAAEARRAAAQSAFEDVQARVIGEIQVARTAFDGRRQELEVAESMLRRATAREESAASLVSAGASDRSAALQASRLRIDAERARLDALVRVQAAQTALERALGCRIPKQQGSEES